MRPSLVQLNSLAAGDFLVILPPPSKADPFGIVWGSLPIYMPFENVRGHAARLVAETHKLKAQAPPHAPLFTQDDGKSFNHRFMDNTRQAWLIQVGLSSLQVSRYSWHSARAQRVFQ